jgi:hypothetical protein
LSTGTLQLSIRCSSVHFGPSRSLPVSVSCWTVAFGAGWSGDRAFWATADHVRQMAKTKTIDVPYGNRMAASQNLDAVAQREWRSARSNTAWISLSTRNPRSIGDCGNHILSRFVRGEICPREKWFCPREKYRLSKVLGLRCSVLALFPRPP